MNILHTVESYSPSVGGMQEVVRQLSERLCLAGHSVTIATSAEPDRTATVIHGVRIVAFPISGNAVRGYQGPVEDYRRFLMESEFDIVTNFAAQQWATDLALPVLRQVKGKHVFVPTGFSALYQPEYGSYFEDMKGWLADYDMNVFLSDSYRDIAFARACGVTRIRVVPNGAGSDEFSATVPGSIRSRLAVPERSLLILLVGSHTGIKGHAEALAMFDRARIRDAALVIVGNEGPCEELCQQAAAKINRSWRRLLDHKVCRVVQLDRRDTVAAFQQADLFLFPSNVECSPIVFFECMASRTPFLTSDVGNAAEVIDWSGGGGVLLPTRRGMNGYSTVIVEEATTVLETVAADPERREQMAARAFDAWKSRFSWEHVAGQYESLYLELLGRQLLATGPNVPHATAELV
jgi:glycosyltransferase involved in cell wall biosynthesis